MKRAGLELFVQGHDASSFTLSHDHMASTSADNDKAKPFQHENAFGSADAGKLRHW